MRKGLAMSNDEYQRYVSSLSEELSLRSLGRLAACPRAPSITSGGGEPTGPLSLGGFESCFLLGGFGGVVFLGVCVGWRASVSRELSHRVLKLRGASARLQRCCFEGVPNRCQ